MSTRFYTLLCVLLLSAAVAMAQAPAAQQMPGQSGYPQQNPGMGRPAAGDPGLPGGQQGQQMPSDSNAQAPSQTVPRVDDSSLTQKVQDTLASNPSLKNVQATVNNGVVNLDGTVASKADKKQVKKMVESIPGVRGVKDHLQVSATPPSTSSNQMFGESISATQATTTPEPNQTQSPSSAPTTPTPPEASPTTQNPTTPSTTTPPDANPTQTPSSAPSTPQQQTPTQPATPDQPGSTSGQATGTTGMEAGAGSDQGLQGEINTALKNEPSLASDTVTANVTSDSIVLSGNVASEKEHKTAKRIAQSFTNNKKLVDNITVGAPH